MNYICDDNRFKIIARYKKELMEATNIEDSLDEMAVLDNILFRFWQMGWLNDPEPIEKSTLPRMQYHTEGKILPRVWKED